MCALCVGGERSGQVENLTALAGPQQQVGYVSGASARCDHRELCVLCVVTLFTGWGHGEVVVRCPQGACSLC